MNSLGTDCFSRTIHLLSTGSSFCYPQVLHVLPLIYAPMSLVKISKWHQNMLFLLLVTFVFLKSPSSESSANSQIIHIKEQNFAQNLHLFDCDYVY